MKACERQNQGNIGGELVPEEGFEPSWDYASRWILSPSRPLTQKQTPPHVTRVQQK
ncbi:MAG: hypothetical protein ACFFDI_13620 [Promethearchaeota archaeon]